MPLEQLDNSNKNNSKGKPEMAGVEAGHLSAAAVELLGLNEPRLVLDIDLAVAEVAAQVHFAKLDAPSH